MEHSKHYDQAYFAMQSSIGEFGGWANRTKFEAWITPDSNVLDFGCGGAYLLKGLSCAQKAGIEVNPSAREEAARNGIQVYPSTGEVPDDFADVIISNNALEHTLQPLAELKALKSKLRPGGKIVFVVPCENISYAYKPRDINYHLYSWSPMCIGNLFTEAGYQVLESAAYIHKWPPNFRRVARFGRRFFEVACRLYGQWERTWFQVRVVATRPE